MQARSFATRTDHLCYFFFFFNDTATTEIYTLSLHDALPILYFVLENDADFACTPTARAHVLRGLSRIVKDPPVSIGRAQSNNAFRLRVIVEQRLCPLNRLNIVGLDCRQRLFARLVILVPRENTNLNFGVLWN